MAAFSLSGIELKGIAAAVPSNEERNIDYKRLSPTELQMLIKTTGVQKRRIAPKGLATSDLCHEAAIKLLDDLNWSTTSVGILIFISQSRDYYLPSTSAILQNRLGLPTDSMCFDVGLGCSGFVYGLSIASSLMKATGIKRSIVLAGDISSAICSYEDKSSYPLFGDAGTACALENTGNDTVSHFEHFTDGSGFESIIIPDGGIRNLIDESSFVKTSYGEGIERSRLNIALNGIDVFNFSISKVPASINQMNNRLNNDRSSYDFLLMHQANKLMNETIRKKTSFNVDQVPYSMDEYGNTSSASIGVTMVTRIREELKKKKLSLMLSGFGVGLSWANAVIQTDHISCPELIEL